MYRPLAIASATWTVAVLAALAGVLIPSEYERLSLALFAFAVALGLLVAALMVADGLRRRRSRRYAVPVSAQQPLDRLEYLPSITTGAWRIQWRGARVRVMPERRTRPASTESAELLGHAPGQLVAARIKELAASTI